VHLPEAENREPVEQGGEAEGEVVEPGRRGEGPLLHTAGDDRGEFIAPRPQEFLQALAHLLVVRRAGPHFHPEDPARIRRAGGQVCGDVPFELGPGAGHAVHGGAGPLEVLLVPPGQGLKQDVFLAGEVVHHLARTHLGPAGDLGDPHLVDADLGDQVQGRVEYAVPAALPVLGAGGPAAPHGRVR
jgi:hypothetical protein